VHIPDGFLSAPVATIGYVAAGATLAYAVAKTKKELGEKEVPLLGVSAAFIFAAQMMNFPVAGGTSGHFVGGFMAALLLGPWAGLMAISVVLILQCLLFADGGLTALGANILNMAIIDGLLPYAIYASVAPRLKTSGARFAAIAALGWFGTVAASIACAMELGISGTAPLGPALAAMAGVHALIGVGEGLITAAVVAAVFGVRKDLVYALKGVEQ